MAHPLIGKTISAVELAEDKKAIRFLVHDGEVIGRADGDCCSDTWIEHVELPALGFPAVVTGVESLLLRESETRGGEEIQFYGLKIVTNHGDMMIDYRNSSNGYYGGSLVFGDEYYYGGVYEQNVSKCEWKPLTNDI